VNLIAFCVHGYFTFLCLNEGIPKGDKMEVTVWRLQTRWINAGADGYVPTVIGNERPIRKFTLASLPASMHTPFSHCNGSTSFHSSPSLSFCISSSARRASYHNPWWPNTHFVLPLAGTSTNAVAFFVHTLP
tara:strand:- start:1196 stop:1591 length:396 start_codon:yes stop_codon:yes gene_type:complete